MTPADQQRRLKLMQRLGFISAVVAPITGLAITIVGMLHAFHTLGSSGHGDPSRLSMAIGGVLFATFGGVLVGFIGLVVAIVARWRVRSLVSPPSPDAPP
ncbi:MAG: MotA/TolQ/ExbB proton channel family protein [Verrucomicrobiaceae bacterium]|nr:MotA/TolQ/ExbB proton channel family protein [Verrucomicrobiaceae bacterium]